MAKRYRIESGLFGDEKRCAHCKKWKPLDEFREINVGARGGSKDRKQKRRSYCHKCHRERNKKSHAQYYKKPEYAARMRKSAIQARWRKVLRELGIDEPKYNEMEAAQGGLCAICGQPETAKFKGTLRRLCIDHDHDTGKVRELLCLDCNAGLGRFKDNPLLLRLALAYLAKHGRM